MDNMREQNWREAAYLILKHKLTSEFDLAKLCFRLLKVDKHYLLVVKELLEQADIADVTDNIISNLSRGK